MDTEKAIAYVQAHGNAVERARLAAILWDEPPPEAALRELAALQKPDGGFAYWVPEVSNVCDTAFVLQWFDDLKVYRGAIVDPACRFLLDRQAGGRWLGRGGGGADIQSAGVDDAWPDRDPRLADRLLRPRADPLRLR